MAKSNYEKVTREIMIDHSIVEEQKKLLIKGGKTADELHEALVNIADFAIYANSKLEAAAEVMAELEDEANPVRIAVREEFSGKPAAVIVSQIMLEKKKHKEAASRLAALIELYEEAFMELYEEEA